MEHSLFHALELTGMIVALGGVLLVVVFVWPANRTLGLDSNCTKLVLALNTNTARWVFYGALAGALATFLDLFVDVAEVRGKTVFSGISLAAVTTFATKTMVGRFALARVGALVLTACAVKLPGCYKWWLTGAAAFGAAVLASMVSHAAAQPTNRFAVMVAQVAHITTVAVWMGVLIHLFASRTLIQGGHGQAGIGLVAEIVRRFSPVALVVTSMLAISGLFMAVRLIGETGAVLTSSYGLTLIVKLMLLVPALVAGSINFRFIRPQLLVHAKADGAFAERQAGKKHALALHDLTPSHSKKNGLQAPDGIGAFAGKKPGCELLRRFGRMLELEVTSGLLVIVAAGILASVSPPGEGGVYRLTERQTQAMLHPHLPATSIVNPATFYGAPERTLEDMHYSEFSHNWSGVMVLLLGVSWMVQSLGGAPGKWAGRVWPFLLIPFAVFLTVISDPEIWWLRRVSFLQVLGDPQLLEHESGKFLLLGVAWLGWRDRKGLETIRPLGYALPVICFMGGFLLLGHAHSTLGVTEELTNLINEQHAVFGAFLIFAGAVRWLALRQLFPPRIAKVLWPAMIIGLGIFMAFFYREAV